MALRRSSTCREDLPKMQPLTKKSFEKMIKRLESLVQTCSNPSLALPQGQPIASMVILSILDRIKTIYNVHKAGPHLNTLMVNEYLIAAMDSLEKNVKNMANHLSENKTEIPLSGTLARRKASTFVVHLSYFQNQLDQFFQNGTYVPRYNFVFKEAGAWWNSNFHDRIFVSWGEFLDTFCAAFNITGKMKTRKLKEEMDFSRSSYITAYEFDIFCRLFRPLANIANTWQLLAADHPGYMPYATYDDVCDFLHSLKRGPGSYVFRMSCTSIGFWSIGFIKDNEEIAQTVIKTKTLAEALNEGRQKEVYLYPAGRHDNPYLGSLTNPLQRVEVTNEQDKEYQSIDMVFDICKICQENTKDTRLEPCGHLMCANCITRWIMSQKKGECPFCRSEISHTVKVVIGREQEVSSPPVFTPQPIERTPGATPGSSTKFVRNQPPLPERVQTPNPSSVNGSSQFFDLSPTSEQGSYNGGSYVLPQPHIISSPNYNPSPMSARNHPNPFIAASPAPSTITPPQRRLPSIPAVVDDYELPVAQRNLPPIPSDNDSDYVNSESPSLDDYSFPRTSSKSDIVDNVEIYLGQWSTEIKPSDIVSLRNPEDPRGAEASVSKNNSGQNNLAKPRIAPKPLLLDNRNSVTHLEKEGYDPNTVKTVLNLTKGDITISRQILKTLPKNE